MTTIDHQQAAVRAGAKALAEHQIGEEWGDDGVTFIGCACGQWFGKRVNDGEELARTHETQAALTAATPHLRAGWAAELLDEGILGAGYSVLMNPVAGDHPVATFTHAIRHMLTLLEGGAE